MKFRLSISTLACVATWVALSGLLASAAHSGGLLAKQSSVVPVSPTVSTMQIATERFGPDSGDSNTNMGVLPPNSHPFGASYGEWSGRWWNWAMGQPLASNPILDPDGSFCGVGQSGQVWFLAGTFGAVGSRSCTVPAGKAIFFPIANVYMNFPCGCPSCAVPGLDPSQIESCLAAYAASGMDDVDQLALEVDGRPVGHLFDFRVRSGLFTFTPDPSSQALDGCILGSQPTAQPAVSDGFWIMLAPLSPGPHTIHFRGAGTLLTYADPDPNCSFAFPFSVDVTYNLTVERRRPGRSHEGGDDSEPTAVELKTWSFVKSLYH